MDILRAGSVRVTSILGMGSLMLFSGGAVRAQQAVGSVVGEIRLLDGGFPNEPLRVSLGSHGMVVDITYCDSEGRFSFNNLLANAYEVVIEKEGYQPVRLPLVVNPTTMQTNLVHVVLRPKPDEKSRGVPDGPPGTNADIVDVAELKKKFPPGVIKEFEAGKKAEQRGEMTAAVRMYEAALREAPDFYPAINNLGIRHLQEGDVKGAETEFRRVIELHQSGAQAYFNLGNVLFMTHRNEEAKQMLEAGLRLSPSNAMGHYLSGSVLARMRDFQPAEVELKTARELDPKMSQVPISLATLYLQTGREHEAAGMFEAFLKDFPKDPMVPKVRAALSKMAHPSSP
ncbi:MAG TPA: tetratricopeptide repeat protein [Candidatus Dormibacteraeota bacterium]|nr:tetratricopeptide repeat protein [Candidatus Dormibacteraeota bacterium]